MIVWWKNKSVYSWLVLSLWVSVDEFWWLGIMVVSTAPSQHSYPSQRLVNRPCFPLRTEDRLRIPLVIPFAHIPKINLNLFLTTPLSLFFFLRLLQPIFIFHPKNSATHRLHPNFRQHLFPGFIHTDHWRLRIYFIIERYNLIRFC